MSGVTRVAIVDPFDDSRENLRSGLLSMESVWLEAECSRYEFFIDAILRWTSSVSALVPTANSSFR